MSKKPNGYLCATIGLQYSGVPTGELWMVGFDVRDDNLLTIERLQENVRGLFGLAPVVTFTMYFLDDEGSKQPLATVQDLDTAYTFRTPDVPMRIAVDLPVPPGTPLPPYTKALSEDTCMICRGAVRGLRFMDLVANGANIICSACYYNCKNNDDHPMVVMPVFHNDQTSRDHEVKRAINDIGRMAAKCDGCKRLIYGIRWKCCECNNTDFCDQCVKRKAKGPCHDPQHHLCPIDQRLGSPAEAETLCRDFLQAKTTGQSRLPGAAGLLLGAPAASATPQMPGMPGMPGMQQQMPGMPGMQQQMPGMPGMQQQMPGMPVQQQMGTPSALSMMLQGQILGPMPGQMMPATMMVMSLPQGQMPPQPTPGMFICQGMIGGSMPGTLVFNIMPQMSGGMQPPQQQQQQQTPTPMPTPQQSMMPPQPQQQWGGPQQQMMMPGMQQPMMPGMPQQQMMPGMPQQQQQQQWGGPQQQMMMPGMQQPMMSGMPQQQPQQWR